MFRANFNANALSNNNVNPALGLPVIRLNLKFKLRTLVDIGTGLPGKFEPLTYLYGALREQQPQETHG